MNQTISLKFRHKSFIDYTHISDIAKYNLVIGKNNAGKTALLEAISDTCDTFENRRYNADFWIHESWEYIAAAGGLHPQVSSDNNILTPLRQAHEEKYGFRYIKNSETEFEILGLGSGVQRPESYVIGAIQGQLSHFFRQKKVCWIRAERDIRPESPTEELSIDSNGGGISRNFYKIGLNLKLFDNHNKLIQFKQSLREIFSEEMDLEDVAVQENPSGKIEINLIEKDAKYIPLTASGSGIKTVVMALYAVIFGFRPDFNISNTVFLFEELENNLHPSVCRRLIQTLMELTANAHCVFFTSHSNVFINHFANLPDAKIFEVQKFEGNSTITEIQTSREIRNTLQNLGFKASDLLQANLIVWVEGPSDRIYFNKWIELYCELHPQKSKIQEGIHYQCMFYGGKLRSHLSINENNAKADLINLLQINRNAILLMDSDIHGTRTEIDATKRRLQEEFQNHCLKCWITDGVEIENYLPGEFLQTHLGIDAQALTFTTKISESHPDFDRKKMNIALAAKADLKAIQLVSPLIDHLSECLEKINAANHIR